MSREGRSGFTGKIGFVMAAASSAVGLGNLWRFPYLAASYGGGIFLLCYVILAVTFGFSLLIGEIALGRMTRLSSIKAFDGIDRRFKFCGILGLIIPTIIEPYYGVIGGWVTKYAALFLTGRGAAATDDYYFSNYITKPAEPVIWFLVFLLLTAAVVLLGVDKGIEKASTVMMPSLIILSMGIAVYIATRPGAGDGIRYFIRPDLSRFNGKTVLAALGQLFYSLSLAMGIMVSYGSYMRKEDNLESSSCSLIPLSLSCRE